MSDTIRFEKGPYAEGATPEISLTSDGSTVTLVDASGAAIPASSVTSFVMTLREVASGAIINSRQNQDVLNTNNVTWTAGGLVTWDVQSADTAIVNGETDIDGIEEHLATFTAKWDSNAEQLSWEILLKIKNLRDVPQASDPAGAYSVPLTIKLTDGTTVEACYVTVTSSSTGPSTSIVDHGITDEDGLVTFSLDTGTYYIWRAKDGIDFDDPKTLTVDGSGGATIS